MRLPVPADPTVSFSVGFRVGSQNDPPGKEGLAYLTGQMIAEASTRTHSYDEILERLYPIASSYAIRVDREMSTLTGRTHRDNAERFLELFSHAYLAPAFDADDFERVRSDAVNYLENTLRYSSDEDLAKAALYAFVYEGTPYAHPSQGTVGSLNAITLADVRDFYDRYYTRDNASSALGGGFDEPLAERFEASLLDLPPENPPASPDVNPTPLNGKTLLLISKPGADASISFGFPINVRRGEREFYALWIANSWLGEHRNSSSHLYQVIREARGLNYGDYSYIEAFPEGGRRNMPPANVPREHQIFEVWIRTLPNDQAHFALRAAIRELALLVDNGMTQEQFELRRSFLQKYVLHFAETTSERLGYAVDDRFYGLLEEGHLERFKRMMQELTLDDVNAAITKHLQYDDLKIAIVTGDAEALRTSITTDAPSPLTYESPKPQAILDEDRVISTFPLEISADRVTVVPVEAMFAGEL